MLKVGIKSTRLRPTPGLLSYIILGASSCLFLLWRLSSQPGGLSSAEINSRGTSENIHRLLTNPADTPYHLLQKLLIFLHPGIFSLRLASVLLAILIILSFYRYMRSLFGRIIGLLGALLLLTLPFFCISARQAAPEVMLLFPLVVMYVYSLFLRSEKKAASWIALVLLAAISAYTPGVLWWLLASAIFTNKKIRANLSKMPNTLIGIGAGIGVLALTPLIVITALHTESLKEILLLPQAWPTPLHFGMEILRMSGAIFIRSQGDNLLLLANLSILNITMLALAAFGSYALVKAAPEKALALGLGIVLAIILAALNGNENYLALAVPALAITVTAGLRYLYVEWRGIFPRNPVPKTFAMLLIAAVALSQIYYGYNYSLHAWPRSQPVRSAYMLK